MRNTIMEISKQNVFHNIETLKAHMNNDTLFCAVIKGNGYGAGLEEIAKLIEDRVDFFAVSLAKDALRLRKIGIKKKILILGSVSDDAIKDIIKKNISLTVFSKEYLAKIEKIAKEHNLKANIHIKFNTGLNRLGFSEKSEIIEIANDFMDSNFIKIEGVYTHLARSDEEDFEFNNMQLERFDELVTELEIKGLRPEIVHAKNSSATVTQKHYEYDMIRAGGLIFGLIPDGEQISNKDFKDVYCLKTKLVQIYHVYKGESVGYGEAYTANKDMLIGILPIGYGDGYPKRLENRGYVLIEGDRYNLIGSIAMDMCAVDLKMNEDLKVGEDVILIGSSKAKKIELKEIAISVDSVETEFITNINPNIDRIYI